MSQPTGPLGGITTTTKSGLVKKNLWIEAEASERLRQLAFELRTSEAEIIRRGLDYALDHADELFSETDPPKRRSPTR